MPNEEGLRALGSQVNGDRVAPNGRVANEDGLRSLGASIDRAQGSGRGGTRGRRRSGRPKWSTRRKVLTVIAAVVAVALLAAGSEFGYVEWKLDHIKSAACPSCKAVVDGQPYNVLIVGSDTRAGDTGAAAAAFGTTAQTGPPRSDTIKIVHVDPAAGTARVLSIPRDTLVQLSGLPPGTGLSTNNKINAAFNNGPEPLIKTIENTFGIPISHYVTIDFTGVINLVKAVGGVNLDFPYPVRDSDYGNNNSGLNIPTAGCQNLSGNMALALSRSRYYQYYADGYWHPDPTSDLGRIQRQNVLIKAVIDKAKGDLNPISLNAVLNAVTSDITKDNGLSGTGLVSLAMNYHAFSASDLQTFTLPTVGGYYGPQSVQIVEQPEAQQMLTQFLGAPPSLTVTTPPLDGYGDPILVPTTTTTIAPPPTSAVTGGGGSTGGTSATTTTTTTTTTLPSYDPTPC